MVAASWRWSLAISNPGIDPERRIQIGQRLVEEEDAGLAHDGPADGDPLALAAGELAGLAVQQRRQMQDLGAVLRRTLESTSALRPPLNFSPKAMLR